VFVYIHIYIYTYLYTYTYILYTLSHVPHVPGVVGGGGFMHVLGARGCECPRADVGAHLV
jgi:hypothetical protein